MRALKLGEHMKDIVVVGGGPAGLTAAVYGVRNGKSVLVIEKSTFGGQINNSPKVENIPGFESISGDDFGERFLEQAMNQGAEVSFAEVTGVSREGDTFLVETDLGEKIEARTVILATGTTHRVLGLPGEEDLIGNGISFCAVCDGDFYRDGTVVMIGGGNSAFVEAALLVEIVGKLVMLQDMPFFTADAKSQEQVFSHGNVETHVGCKILGYVTEGGKLTGVRYEEGGIEKTAMCDGVFLAVGLVPENDAFAGLADLNRWGYFDSGEDCHTKTPGLFVAGDARSKTLRQVTTACADGAQAAIEACNYIRNELS